jgi:anthranilate synthase component 1
MHCSILPNHKAFGHNFQKGKTQVVCREVIADVETPVSAFIKLAYDNPYAFLLESVEGGAILGRYSAIGMDPDLIWKYEGGKVIINDTAQTDDPVSSLREQIRRSKIDELPDNLPPMAKSGLFGYMGYDMVRLVEDIPDSNPDTLNIPDGVLIRPTVMVIFDNIKHTMMLVTTVYEHSGNSQKAAKEVYDAAVNKLSDALAQIGEPLDISGKMRKTGTTLPLEVESNMDGKYFHDMVRKTVEYINAGDIFQAVVGQRFSAPFDIPAFELYRTLRRINPSPFLFFLNFEGFSIVGSSPEIMVRVRDRTVTIRPIAGTRPRGSTPEEDRELAAALLEDPKELAEHLMLLDLGRNDVGRVAKIGSVHVTDKFFIEYYSHVMHIVSNVEGTLHENLDAIDALFAGFPAGTVSGAPKVRAMEIIDELEPVRRSYYAGCAGYISAEGDLDTCIALRTALVKDGRLYVQASGGIVADSVPETEYQESCNKARALINAAAEALQNSRDFP